MHCHTSVQTHSKKNVIVTNRLFSKDSKFDSKTQNEKKQQWQWARSSEQAKEFKQLQQDFLATICATKKIALLKKEKGKLEKKVKLFKKLDSCKEHGGPVTQNSVDLLDNLNSAQLLNEIGYLRMTTAPHIRQMKRVKVDGKYKILKFSDNELKTSIMNCIKPSSDISNDVESLLQKTL